MLSLMGGLLGMLWSLVCACYAALLTSAPCCSVVWSKLLCPALHAMLPCCAMLRLPKAGQKSYFIGDTHRVLNSAPVELSHPGGIGACQLIGTLILWFCGHIHTQAF